MSETWKPTMKVQAYKDGSVRWIPIATPPTPDLDAVVARVRGYLDETEPARHDVIEAMRDGTVDVRLSRSDLRTLLAAVSRPAEARGEPVAWQYRITKGEGFLGGRGAERGLWLTASEESVRRRLRECGPERCEIRALYTHPAPSGGEAVAEYWCVMFGDNEDTGDLFAFKEDAHAHARDLDAKYPDTAHVVVRLVAPSLEGVRPAAPRPETGEVSEAAQALVEKLDVVHAHPLYMGVWMGAVAHGGAYVGPTYEAELNALRAALAAERGTP